MSFWKCCYYKSAGVGRAHAALVCPPASMVSLGILSGGSTVGGTNGLLRQVTEETRVSGDYDLSLVIGQRTFHFFP